MIAPLKNARIVHPQKNVLIVLGMNVVVGEQLIKKLRVQNKTKKGILLIRKNQRLATIGFKMNLQKIRPHKLVSSNFQMV